MMNNPHDDLHGLASEHNEAALRAQMLMRQ